MSLFEFLLDSPSNTRSKRVCLPVPRAPIIIIFCDIGFFELSERLELTEELSSEQITLMVEGLRFVSTDETELFVSELK